MPMDSQVQIPTKMLSGRPCSPGSLRWSEEEEEVLREHKERSIFSVHSRHPSLKGDALC